jgi:hypothetical protein
MTFEEFDWQRVLDNWDVEEEQKKADFIEFLYELYQPGDGLYTGLWQRFKEDIALSMRNMFFEKELAFKRIEP